MKLFPKTLLAAAAFAVSGFASAAYILVDNPGGDTFAIPGTNNYASGSGGTFVADAPRYGVGDTLQAKSSLEYATNETLKLRFTFLGYEAGWKDVFTYGGVEIFDTKSPSTVGDTFSTYVTPTSGGLVDFGFATYEDTGTVQQSQLNDSTNGGTSFNFLLQDIGGGYFTISLDDNNIFDDNHDDMVIELHVSSVPEPGTLALLGLGLAGVALRFKGKK